VKASSSEVLLVARFEGRGVWKGFVIDDFELRRGKSQLIRRFKNFLKGEVERGGRR
jgi:hypothetical protein